jgi:hypothetical protein
MIEQPDRKFEEIYDVSDYEVWTDTGWRDISKVCKTVPYEVWRLSLEHGSHLECADDHIVFSEGEEVFVKDLQIGQSVDTDDGESEVVSVENTHSSENMYDLQVDGGRYYSNGILSHNTSLVGVYILWYAMFHADKTIGIVSNKEKSAKMILRRIKRMYESLPVWMKPGVKNYSETFIIFDNNVEITVSATSPDAFRGASLAILFCDEFAFVPRNQAEEFWAANYPTISSSEEAKIIIASTPNGMYNLFHRIYIDAERGRNSFYSIKVSWHDDPTKNEKWAEEQLKNLGEVKFNQEINIQFLGSSNTVINTSTLERLVNEYEEPKYIELEDNFLIYEKPVQGCYYVLGVDTSKGTGEHYSTVQVLKMESMKPIKLTQVALYINNTIDVYSFSDLINKISYYYNNAYIMVENNSEGAAVVNRLWWDLENPNLVNTGSKAINLGVRATRTSKPKAVLLMKKLIEDGSLKLVDRETINELTCFVDEGNKYYGKEMADDAISALYWAVYILHMGVLSESFEFKKEAAPEDEGWGVLSDSSSPEDDWSWLTSGSLRD